MEYNFRTLNYLGSKFRLLDFIEENILNVTKEGEGVCDLFAGSCCVSYKLSNHFSVLSCDIQKYSQIISNAILKKYSITEEEIDILFLLYVMIVNCSIVFLHLLR